MLVYERQPLATLLYLIPQSLHRLHPLNLLLNQATCPAEFCYKFARLRGRGRHALLTGFSFHSARPAATHGPCPGFRWLACSFRSGYTCPARRSSTCSAQNNPQLAHLCFSSETLMRYLIFSAAQRVEMMNLSHQRLMLPLRSARELKG